MLYLSIRGILLIKLCQRTEVTLLHLAMPLTTTVAQKTGFEDCTASNQDVIKRYKLQHYLRTKLSLSSATFSPERITVHSLQS